MWLPKQPGILSTCPLPDQSSVKLFSTGQLSASFVEDYEPMKILFSLTNKNLVACEQDTHK